MLAAARRHALAAWAADTDAIIIEDDYDAEFRYDREPVGAHRSTGAVRPPQLVLGFGNLTERTIAAGIAAVGDLLQGG